MAIETVLVPKQEYDRLVKVDAWADALIAAGVDNWDGYGYAFEDEDDEEDDE